MTDECKKFTYGNDPANSSTDAVRFLVGDTVRRRVLLDDKEIDWALLQAPNKFMAAALLADHLCARFSQDADISVGSVSKSLSAVAEAFRQKAKDLRSDACSGVRVSFPATTTSEKQKLEGDSNLPDPSFKIGQFDNPFATQLDGLLSREDLRGCV